MAEPEAIQHESQWADHKNRTLIVCFDGHGDKFDADNSNVVQFISMLKKDNNSEQMVYYQPGIGTDTSSHAPGFVDAITRRFAKVLDQAIAWSLPLRTQAGYEFLMQNYEYGDKMCIFGFSRGAYTARALAGMLTKVGLLPTDNKEQIPFAYKMYAREDEFGWKQSCAFRNAFSIKVQVDFLGVWDNVNSVGLVPHRLPFTMGNSGIRVYRHAVSLDERRAEFAASLAPQSGGAEEGHHHSNRDNSDSTRRRDGAIPTLPRTCLKFGLLGVTPTSVAGPLRITPATLLDEFHFGGWYDSVSWPRLGSCSMSNFWHKSA